MRPPTELVLQLIQFRDKLDHEFIERDSYSFDQFQTLSHSFLQLYKRFQNVDASLLHVEQVQRPLREKETDQDESIVTAREATLEERIVAYLKDHGEPEEYAIEEIHELYIVASQLAGPLLRP